MTHKECVESLIHSTEIFLFMRLWAAMNEEKLHRIEGETEEKKGNHLSKCVSH